MPLDNPWSQQPGSDRSGEDPCSPESSAAPVDLHVCWTGTAGPQIDGPTGTDVAIQPLSAGEWRVCDRRLSDHDAHSLLGFIEKVGDRFEVMHLARGFQWFQFASLAEAVRHFTGEEPDAAIVGALTRDRQRTQN